MPNHADNKYQSLDQIIFGRSLVYRIPQSVWKKIHNPRKLTTQILTGSVGHCGVVMPTSWNGYPVFLPHFWHVVCNIIRYSFWNVRASFSSGNQHLIKYTFEKDWHWRVTTASLEADDQKASMPFLHCSQNSIGWRCHRAALWSLWNPNQRREYGTG